MNSGPDNSISVDDKNVQYIASKLNTENFNSPIFSKYIDVNLIAMQSNHLAMKNLQAFNDIISKQLTRNTITKVEAKPDLGTPKSNSVAEKKVTAASPSSSNGIRILSDEPFINKKLTCVVGRLPKDFQSQLKKNRKSDDYKADKKQNFQCTECQLKFKLNFLLNCHMKSCHINKEELQNKFDTKPDSNDANCPTTSNNKSDPPSIINENENDIEIFPVRTPMVQLDNESSSSESVVLLSQQEKPVAKKCSVILNPLSGVQNEAIKKQQVAKKARLLKKKLAQDMMKSSKDDKPIRIITRDVTHKKLLSRKRGLNKLLGYINTVYIDKPIRLD